MKGLTLRDAEDLQYFMERVSKFENGTDGRRDSRTCSVAESSSGEVKDKGNL